MPKCDLRFRMRPGTVAWILANVRAIYWGVVPSPFHSQDLAQAPARSAAAPLAVLKRPPRRFSWQMCLWLAPLTLLLAFAVAVSIGPVTISLGDVFAVFAQKVGLPIAPKNPAAASLIMTVRAPRALLACLVGAGLAIAGTVMQAVFRNPLAEPGITGVSSGAAVGAVITLVTPIAAMHPLATPAAAFVGAMLAVLAVQVIAGAARPGSASTLLLVGIAINALLGAVIAAALANAPRAEDVRRVMFWLNGDLIGTTWTSVTIAIAPILLGIVILSFFTRELDLFLLGHDTATVTGMNTTVTRQLLLLVAAVVTAAGVSVTGIIAFVGLVVPHLVRLLVGPGHRMLVPLATITGATFLCLADVCARMIFQPIVLQTGTITALVGAPVLLYLVSGGKRRAS